MTDEKKLFILERIEDGMATLEAQDGTHSVVPLCVLPSGVKEGCVLVLSSGRYIPDEEATAARRQAVLRKQRRLFH